MCQPRQVPRLLLLVLACLLCVQAYAQPDSRRIRGDIAAVDGMKMQVTTRSGEKLLVDLDDKYTVTAIARTDIGGIKCQPARPS